MYSVLLVEDEKLELETLRDYVDWKSLGITRVYTARNGKRALEYVEEYDPDIVITDIQMPVMGGIELANRIVEGGYPCKIVFLTGYGDFEYVKAAFHVRAVDFILKPFTVEEIAQCMKRVEQEIEKNRAEKDSKALAANEFFSAVVSGTFPEERMEEYCRILFDESPDKISFSAAAVYIRMDEQQIKELKDAFHEIVYISQREDLSVIYLADYAAPVDAAGRICGFFADRYEKKTAVGWSAAGWTLREMGKAAAWFEKYQDAAYFMKIPGVFQTNLAAPDARHLPDKQEWKEQQIQARELVRALGKGDADAAGKIWEKYFRYISGYGKGLCIRETYVLYLYLRDHLVMEDHMLEGWMKEYFSGDTWMQAESAWELNGAMNAYMGRILEFFVKQNENPNYSAVQYVKFYLEENYHQPVELEQLSRKVGLSQNYLRSLFKEQVGKTVSEYSLDVRMKKACELLKDKTMKVKDVSLAVGYENVSYFGMLFQKKYGVTPNEYRKMV